MSAAKKKPLLIVNPRSGGGQAGAQFDKLRAPIESGIGAFDAILTERGRHAVDIAREEALAGRDILVAVGGDGLIHEVVNGIMEAKTRGASAPRLGIIGQGTGGDFRKTLGLEHRLDKYCAAIANGRAMAVDVGRFDYVSHEGEAKNAYFMNILSIGMGGLVDRYVANTTKAFGGGFAYFAASVRGLVESQVGVLRLTMYTGKQEQVEQLESRNISICNGGVFGGGMKVCPMAKVDDGLFNIVDLGAGSRVGYAMQSSKMYSGEHVNLPNFKHFTCDRVKVELLNKADKFLLDVDGEPLGAPPVDIRVERAAIEVFVP
jgi:YegS/Rv2252/BmrU family lipid kinase